MASEDEEFKLSDVSDDENDDNEVDSGNVKRKREPADSVAGGATPKRARASSSPPSSAASSASSTPNPTPKRKPRTIAAASDEEDEDDDEDNHTTTAPATAPAIKKEPQASPASTPSRPPSSRSTATPRKAVKAESESSDGEDGDTKKKAPSKPTPSPKPAATKRKRVIESSEDEESSASPSEDEEDDDFDDDSDSSKKKTPARSPRAKKAASPRAKKAATPKKTPTKRAKKDDDKKPSSRSKGKDKAEESPKKGRKKKGEQEEGQEEWEWWKEETLPKGQRWKTLEHHGVLFPPPYEPHGIKMLYNGKPIKLPSNVEEIVTAYATYLETDHVKKAAFRKNFFDGLKELIKGTDLEDVITEFDKCDFTPINKFLQERRDAKKARSTEEKKEEKAKAAEIQAKYGFALVDGHKQKVGNYRVEPPGLFLGRGAHPKTGMIKQRIMPEDITINIGKKAKVPPCPIEGHNWGNIVHNNKVTWLAFWKENINGNFKYVWLSASSAIKGQSDMKKFEVSRGLKNKIEKIRRTYMKELKSNDMRVRQRATALWVIDHLALRVGNEKGKDEADTVGCCSLRCEHVNLVQPNTIEFDFLGKDSMRYQNSVQVPELVFKNFQLFKKGKKKSETLFDRLTTSALNVHLKSMMPGLTAKVFRTFNASFTLQQELQKGVDPDASVHEKFLFYNRANKQVSILCNHQRSKPKKHDEQMEKLDVVIEDIEHQKKELKRRYAAAKAGKAMPKPLPPIKREIKAEIKEEGESESSTPKKPAAASKKDVKKEDIKEEKIKKERELPSDPDRIKKAIAKLDARLLAKQTEKINKEELVTVALGTAKINYMDPRITVAWCKKYGVPIEKIFAKSLRDKFPWAMDVDEDFVY